MAFNSAHNVNASSSAFTDIRGNQYHHYYYITNNYLTPERWNEFIQWRTRESSSLASRRPEQGSEGNMEVQGSDDAVIAPLSRPYAPPLLLASGLPQTQGTSSADDRFNHLIEMTRDASNLPSSHGKVSLHLLDVVPPSVQEPPRSSPTGVPAAATIPPSAQTPNINDDPVPLFKGTLTGHNALVSSVSFSGDGKRIVSGSADETVRVWDLEALKMVSGPFKGHSGASGVSSVAFSPDGSRVVSGFRDGKIRFWDVTTGRALTEPLKEHTQGVKSVAFSPDGKHVVSGSADRTIRVWDTDSWRAVSGYSNPRNSHTSSVNAVAFSSDGKQVVSGSNDSTVRVWDAGRWKPVSEPFKDSRQSAVIGVAFSSDCQRIVSCSSRLYIWDAKAGDVIHGPLGGRVGAYYSVVFSPDGRWIIAGTSVGSVEIWDVQTGEVEFILTGHAQAGPVYSVAISPNGKQIVSGSFDHTIRVYSFE